MAKARTKGSDEAAARFGAGRAPASAGAKPVRIGTKDENQKRAVNLGVRFTALEVEALRLAFDKHGAGRSFAQFVGSVLTDGLDGLEGGLSVILPAAPDPSKAIEELRGSVEARVAAMESAAELQAERLAGLARHQKGLAARAEATTASVDNLTQTLAAMSEQLESMSIQMATAIRALDEVGKRKAPGAARQATDEYSRKLI